MTMRSQETGRPLASGAPAQTPPAYDTPEAVIDEIFGASATGEGCQPGGQAGVLVADLRDMGEALVLQFEARGEGSDRPQVGQPRDVVDMAEADRIITTWLKAHPGWSVERAGDGWITHSE
jgi:hypothetical protein